MAKFLLALTVALCGCDIPTGLTDHLERLTIAAEVSSVFCAPAALEIAIREAGSCSARNSDMTFIDVEGFSPVVWRSSDPSAVSVSLSGDIFAETDVSASVIITAVGTNGTNASFTVSSF